MHVGEDLSQTDAMIWLVNRLAETTIVCGLERLGLRVARALIQLGEKVIIVADSPQPAILREARKAGARIVEGRSYEVAELRGVELATARCLVLTDNADLGNLHTALAAREVNPRLRIVMRMFNADLADRATKLLPNSRVLSATYEAAPYFAADALGIAFTAGRLVWGRYLIVHSPSGDGGRAPHRIEHRLPSEPIDRVRSGALTRQSSMPSN